MRELQVIEVVGEPGIGKSRLVRELRTLALGFTRSTRRPNSTRHRRRSTRGGTCCDSSRITPESTAEQAGSQLAPFVSGVMPDLAPWLPLLAIPFDAEVLPTPEVDASTRRKPREAARDRRDLPRADPHDADAARRRGRALARRLVAVAAPGDHAEAGGAAVADLRDDASRLGVERPPRRAGATRRPRAARCRPSRRAGPDSRRRGGVLQRDVAALTDARRQPALRPRARGRGARRRSLQTLPESVESLLRRASTARARATGCCSVTRRSSDRPRLTSSSTSSRTRFPTRATRRGGSGCASSSRTRAT